MLGRQPRVLTAVLIAAAAGAAAAPSPAAADHGKAVAVSAPSSTTMRVSTNRALLPTPDPVYGRDAIGIAVNPRNAKHIVAVYNDYQTLWCEVAVSFDGGKKWRRSRLKAPPGFIHPPCTVGSHLANFLDGSIRFGQRNTVYTTFASGRADENDDSRGKSVLVARSTNGGRSFETGVVALPGGEDVDAGPDYILPKLTLKPGSRGAADRIYLVANSSETRAPSKVAENRTIVTTSSDGGRTWAPPSSASPAGQSAIEATEPVLIGDTLYVAWRTQNPAATPGRYLPKGTLVVGKSTDLGRTWTRSTVAGVTGFIYNGPVTPPYSVTPTSFTASTFPRLAGDPKSGNLYIAYGNGDVPTSQTKVVTPVDHFIHNDMDVYFQRSTDGGTVWSDPARLNRNAPIQLEVTQTRHPNLSVAPNGRLDVVWQDRRHWYLGPNHREPSGACTHTHVACDEARLGDTYYRSSKDGGRTFSTERRITDHSINNDVGYDYRFGAYWDYGPKALPIGNSRVLFAWMDSRDGNVETDAMGIYLAEANLNGSRNIPLRRIARKSPADLAVQMSRRAYPGGPESTLASTFASRPWTRVVIANERDLAGALAGGVLGRAFLGPVLVTPRGGLSPAVREEVARLAPIGAYVIGGPESLSDQVLADLAATGIPQDQVIRLAGPTPADTAAVIARTMDRRTELQTTSGVPAFDAAVIVNPASPDAAAISVLAANRRFPVLLTDANALPAATAQALRDLGITRTIVMGTNRYVNASVLAGLPKPQRLGGRNAVATSRVVVAQSRRWGVPTNVVYSVNLTRRMDAALMGAPLARIGGQLLLSPGGAPEAQKVLNQLKMRTMVDRLYFADRSRTAKR